MDISAIMSDKISTDELKINYNIYKPAPMTALALSTNKPSKHHDHGR